MAGNRKDDGGANVPDSADAYLLLAEQARSRKEALSLYEKAVAAGERALGHEAFQKRVGHFWSIPETRPYMRARLHLAMALWTAGRRDEAVQHLQDMLRLNPNDNQSVRYTLAGFLLFLDQDDVLARLLDRYPEEVSTPWAYTRALLVFRQQGDTIEARRALKGGKKANKHVPEYLLGWKLPPLQEPGYYRPGDRNEALNYIGGFLVGWKATPGAVAWLRENVKARRKAETPQPKGPLGFIKTWLRTHLPRQEGVWQADFRQMPNWIRIGGEPVRPWVVLVTDRGNDLILAHQMPEETPSPAFLWDALVQAMQHPSAGVPHRPVHVQVRADERWESLKPHLAEIEIDLVVCDTLDQLDGVFKGMTEHVAGKPRPSLLDAPGVTSGQVGSFFAAAAAFFRQAPWKKVGLEAAIKVECDRFQSGPWYAVLMGQSGLTIGLALYEDLSVLRGSWSADGANEDTARRTVGTCVTFGEEWEIPVPDLEAARKDGWQVARSDAYPHIFHKEFGSAMRPPLTWELELLEACLRVVPDFANRRKQDDPTREEVMARVASGPLKLGLSWVMEEEA